MQNPSAIEICDGIDNNCDGKVDEADKVIKFDGLAKSPKFISPRFCIQTNPNYPYHTTVDFLEYTTVTVKYYVINSLDEWNELCKNERKYQNIITRYVDFSTQTVLAFEISGGLQRGGCIVDGWLIGSIKAVGDTLYIRYGFLEPFRNCLAIFSPPFYDLVATEEKLYPSAVVMKMIQVYPGEKDFCPYEP